MKNTGKIKRCVCTFSRIISKAHIASPLTNMDLWQVYSIRISSVPISPFSFWCKLGESQVFPNFYNISYNGCIEHPF